MLGKYNIPSSNNYNVDGTLSHINHTDPSKPLNYSSSNSNANANAHAKPSRPTSNRIPTLVRPLSSSNFIQRTPIPQPYSPHQIQSNNQHSSQQQQQQQQQFQNQSSNLNSFKLPPTPKNSSYSTSLSVSQRKIPIYPLITPSIFHYISFNFSYRNIRLVKSLVKVALVQCIAPCRYILPAMVRTWHLKL
jgi:hypothetical protein